MAEEITDHGQNLNLRTRRGADFALLLSLTEDDDVTPIDLSGAVGVTRVFAPGKADVNFSAVVDGPAGTILITLTAAQTTAMQQNWDYVAGYRDSFGGTHPLLFGTLLVSQDRL